MPIDANEPAEPALLPPRPERPRAFAGPLVIALGIAALAASIYASARVISAAITPPPASVVEARPTPTLLVAIRDLARLETTEVQIEKVIDLTDRQSRFFGLVEGTDALLLVASGRAVIGLDLSKLDEGDVRVDAERKAATLRLPKPDVLGASLDEKSTYVYTRSTSLLGRRNEQLESRARQEAVAAIEKAARADDVMARARTQAERQLRALVTQLGFERVEISWR